MYRIKITSLFIFFSFLLLIFVYGFIEDPKSPEQEAKNSFIKESQVFKNEMKTLLSLSHSEKITLEELRNQLKRCRLSYKKLELFVGYFTDVTEKEINGPLLIEVEEFDPLNLPIPPQGLQVLEEILYQDSLDYALLQGEVKRSNSSANKLYQLCTTQDFASWQLFDAMRDQIRRIMAIGLNNFDTPYSENCFEESAASLETVSQLIALYATKKSEVKQINKLLKKAIKTLKKETPFETFDRLHFIINYLDPIYQKLHLLQRSLNIAYYPIPKPLSDSVLSSFSAESWNVSYFTNNYPAATKEQIALGKILFFDPILSGNNKRSCASCHQLDKDFSDGLRSNSAFDFQGTLERNTPSLINVSLQKSFFWDNRVSSLEEQAKDVTTNQVEMHGNFDSSVEKLLLSEEYKTLFAQSFPSQTTPAINARNIQKALAAYESTLIALNSPFDQYLRRESNSLPIQAQNGFNIFMGKAACGTCHFFPLFNGTLPPHYKKTEAEVLGVGEDTTHQDLDNDLGKYNKTLVALHKNSFKTPGIRNLNKTGPYMHNGAYPNLESLIRFYNLGGGSGFGFDVPNQTLSADALNLSAEEQEQLIVFLESLNDTKTSFEKPQHLPFIPGHNRKIGGEY